MSSFSDAVTQDIMDWIINFVEVPHKFYDYKYAPCPFAKKQRELGNIQPFVYEGGGVLNHFWKHIDTIDPEDNFTKLFIFPARVKWYYHFRFIINQLNKKFIPHNMYLQYGVAKGTSSRYPGPMQGKPYFLVTTNKISLLTGGYKSLMESGGYYDKWSKEHFKTVVERRNRAIDKYSKKS